MTAFNYADARSTAEELIAEFGQIGAIRRQAASGQAHDPTLTPTDYPVTMVMLGYANAEVDGTLILASDRKVYVSTEGLSIEPSASDKLVPASGEELQIVSVKPLAPAGTIIFYEIQARS